VNARGPSHLIVAALPLLAACAAVLGIDDLPVALTVPARIDATSEQPPASSSCGDPSAPFCARTCPAFDFCDDFEGQTGAFDRWDSPSLVGKPFRTDDFTGNVDVIDSVDHGAVLAVRVQSSNNEPAAIGIIHRMKAFRPADGAFTNPSVVHMIAQARIRSVDLNVSERDFYRLSFLGLGSFGLPATVVSFYVRDELDESTVHAGVIERSVSDPPIEEVRATDFAMPRANVFNEWLDFEYAAGTRTALRRHGFACTPEPIDGGTGAPIDGGDGGDNDAAADAGADADVEDGQTYMFVRGFRTFERCIPLSRELADQNWQRSPAVFGGASLTDYSSALMHFDNVAVRYLE